MHTAFVESIPTPGNIIELEKRERDHLFKTLRCRCGEKLRLCDGNGTVAEAEATAERCIKVLSTQFFEPDSIELHVFAALPKNAKLDALLKPITEAGASSITPLKCRYSVSEKSEIPERWYTLLEEGCKQSGNPFLPRINNALTVAEAIDHCIKNDIKIFFGAQHGILLLPENLSHTGKLKMAWMVGPEGGFDEKELELLNRSGQGITLGKYIFRLENAALAGTAYLLTIARAAEKVQ